MRHPKPQSSVWGLVPAGGRGERFGGRTPKQLISINGRPVLGWTVERLLQAGLAGLTVALPPAWLDSAETFLPADERVSWVAGGETRQHSVAACLAACPAEYSTVLVHDGARPAVAVVDLMQAIEAAAGADGAVLGRPVADTLKRVDEGEITATVDREGLFRAETPQVFRRRLLEQALRQSAEDGFTGTDEASIVERLPGVRIRAVTASQPNPKLTRREDLPWVERLLMGEGGV